MQRAKIFRFMEQVENAYNESRYGKQPHRLTDDDLTDWSTAAEAGFKLKPQTVAQVQAALRQINPVRWRQVQGDLRWVEKQMKKLGLNPEDARFVL